MNNRLFVLQLIPRIIHEDNLFREPLSVMWSRIVDIWTMRNDSKWIDGWMAPIVMLLNVHHVDCATNSRDLKYVFGVIEDVGILT